MFKAGPFPSSFCHIFPLQSFRPLYYHFSSSFLSSFSVFFSHWEVMPCGCCASRSVSEPLQGSDRVASLVTLALILPHVKTNPVLTLADQYSSSRAGKNATRVGGSNRTANLAPGESYYISTDGGGNADFYLWQAKVFWCLDHSFIRCLTTV